MNRTQVENENLEGGCLGNIQPVGLNIL